MPNKVTMRMPSKTQYIMKYGQNWFYEWDKARKEYNKEMGIHVKMDWIESKISTYKNFRYGHLQGKIMRMSIYEATWQKPEVINFYQLPADLKYHDAFEHLKP